MTSFRHAAPLVVVLAACAQIDEPQPEPEPTLTLTPRSVVLPVSQQIRLGVSVIDAAGIQVVSPTIAWSSSNTSVSVDPSGTARGSSIGQAYVKAKYTQGSQSATDSVLVRVQVSIVVSGA